MTTHQVDYSKLFEVQDVPKINGESNYVSLTKLEDLLKANASRIMSELRGGNHRHLGLILIPQKYASVSNTPYICPTHPGKLTVPQGTAQHAATILRLCHKKATDLYHKTVDVDNTLWRQIINAVESMYLNELQDVRTNMIVHSLPQIFAHLYAAYGDITSETLKEREKKVLDMSYSLTKPLTKIYLEIDNLQKLRTAANISYTP